MEVQHSAEVIETTCRFKSYSSTDPIVNYISSHSLRVHPQQQKLIEATRKCRNAHFLSSTDEMQLLANLCRHMGFKNVLDIGTYTGYSALSLALALPAGGRVLTCDITDEYVAVGKPIWEEAGVADKIHMVLGPALETLGKAIENGESGRYDFVYIDADKPHYPEYYELCLQLIRPGGLIAIDNVLWGGAVIDPSKTDPEVTGIRALNTKIATDERVDISMLSIADGLTLAFKR